VSLDVHFNVHVPNAFPLFSFTLKQVLELDERVLGWEGGWVNGSL
jgi:hypothetical protein